ncbi:unnamed protein product, partial [Rotaria sordida]
METTQYSTPTAQEQRTEEPITTTTTTTTTSRLAVTTTELPLLKESLTPRGPSTRRQRQTTTRQIEIIDLGTPIKTP